MIEIGRSSRRSLFITHWETVENAGPSANTGKMCVSSAELAYFFNFFMLPICIYALSNTQICCMMRS